jgi:hypothetical protein
MYTPSEGCRKAGSCWLLCEHDARGHSVDTVMHISSEASLSAHLVVGSDHDCKGAQLGCNPQHCGADLGYRRIPGVSKDVHIVEDTRWHQW